MQSIKRLIESLITVFIANFVLYLYLYYKIVAPMIDEADVSLYNAIINYNPIDMLNGMHRQANSLSNGIIETIFSMLGER